MSHIFPSKEQKLEILLPQQKTLQALYLENLGVEGLQTKPSLGLGVGWGIDRDGVGERFYLIFFPSPHI